MDADFELAQKYRKLVALLRKLEQANPGEVASAKIYANGEITLLLSSDPIDFGTIDEVLDGQSTNRS